MHNMKLLWVFFLAQCISFSVSVLPEGNDPEDQSSEDSAPEQPRVSGSSGQQSLLAQNHRAPYVPRGPLFGHASHPADHEDGGDHKNPPRLNSPGQQVPSPRDPYIPKGPLFAHAPHPAAHSNNDPHEHPLRQHILHGQQQPPTYGGSSYMPKGPLFAHGQPKPNSGHEYNANHDVQRGQNAPHVYQSSSASRGAPYVPKGPLFAHARDSNRDHQD